ncbi:MAG: 4-hydroxy-tetrahydrodipicolinate synthase [Spirochaetes bacterium ADurb.Bin218]|jgi:4-hydroxy-tetrahydrodipicolinate synthase|nr:4-hydroxy-tetrahydrodipicolinate synthase [Spirochaetota bacterium]OQB00207.1 MAG: 4-hydroxy-tetrahydrodipicolinate synthase [Spirochaetes bacterium ADurb.Bin218]HOQ12007.1 4-hydroxy-tetrahydrodipicolinate synthase [Spirochaetota bacterium]HOV07738.1 4-hydroxy-tetrahydrodipicolinate synthase [Spirochaetota bacterium]HPD78145.1 4-hydroxy-tetrahydrodipicolinate synthase [Spirochaetota bacterium]
MFEGAFTALVTPFKNGKIDYDALEKHIEFQIAQGIDGVLPMGTTGESPTVSFEEHEEFIRRVVKIVNGRVKVLAGTGANSTSEAVWLTKCAEDAGVDAALSVNPYYNKPTQKGLIAHYEQIAKSTKLPIILYNIPGRTGVNFLPESIKELLNRVDNVVAMKEASGDINQMMRLVELCGDKLTLLSGDDNLLLPLLSIGGKGVISVLSNILPADVRKVITLFNENKLDEAKALFYKLLPLCRAMFLETNPIPVKTAMAMMGFCNDELRLPLTPLGEENRKVLRKTLEEYGINLK